MEVLHAVQLEDLDLSHATFSRPDLDSFCRLDPAWSARVRPARRGGLAWCWRAVVVPDDWCHGCGARGVFWDTVERRLAYVPSGWHPTTLSVRVRRYACTG